MQVAEFMAVHRELLLASPLRQAGRPFPGPLAAALEGGALERLVERWDAVAAGLIRPLRLVLMGEVKAGKSTLVNALAGAQVSPVDVLEATAAILTIAHGEAPRAAIHYRSGEVEEGTPEAIHQLLARHQGDAAFFAQVDHVAVALPLPALRALHLVDTPGLATITQANVRRVREFIDQADVVLWIFNAHHLGQADVAAELARVVAAGRPVVGVINRVDEVDGDPARLVAYVERQYRAELKAVFAISARQALAGTLQGDGAAWEKSGVPALLRYLEQNVERQASRVQLESVLQAARSLLRQDRYLHDRARREVALLVQQVERARERASAEAERVAQAVGRALEAAVETQFLSQELATAQSLLEEGGAARRVDLRAHFAVALTEERLRAFWAQLMAQAQAQIEQEWQQVAVGLQQEAEADWAAFLARERERLQAALRDLPDTSINLPDRALQWGLGGAAAGLGLAIATASGPAAVGVPILAAMGSSVPPLLLAGAAAGVIQAYFQAKREREQARYAAQELVVRLRQHLVEHFLRPHVLPQVQAACQAMAGALAAREVDRLAPGWAGEELAALARALDDYLDRLGLALEAEVEVSP